MTDKQMKCIEGKSCLHCGTDCCKFVDEFKQLKAEDERLKYNNDYEIGALEKTIDNLTAENDKLKQTLAEIKEIVEQGVMFEQILQKISESEVEND